MSSFVIQDMTAADLPTALSLLERSGLPIVGVEEHFNRFFVARGDETVIGTAGLESYGADGLLRSLVVDESRRLAGIASALMEHVVARAVAARLQSLYLLTTTARSYFERSGFLMCPRGEAPPSVSESWQFQTGCPDTAVFMRLQLSGRPTAHTKASGQSRR